MTLPCPSPLQNESGFIGFSTSASQQNGGWLVVTQVEDEHTWLCRYIDMEQSWFCWYVDMLAGYEGDPRRDIFRTRHGGLMFNCWFQILLLVRFVIVVVVFFFSLQQMCTVL